MSHLVLFTFSVYVYVPVFNYIWTNYSFGIGQLTTTRTRTVLTRIQWPRTLSAEGQQCPDSVCPLEILCTGSVSLLNWTLHRSQSAEWSEPITGRKSPHMTSSVGCPQCTVILGLFHSLRRSQGVLYKTSNCENYYLFESKSFVELYLGMSSCLKLNLHIIFVHSAYNESSKFGVSKI